MVDPVPPRSDSIPSMWQRSSAQPSPVSDLPYRRDSGETVRPSDGYGGFATDYSPAGNRDSTLSVGVDIPIMLPTPPLRPEPHRPPTLKKVASHVYPKPQKTTLPTIPQSPPVQSQEDPTVFRLPPPRGHLRSISAPLQPRVMDVRMHMEQDKQEAFPTYNVELHFRFSMRPGHLP